MFGSKARKIKELEVELAQVKFARDQLTKRMSEWEILVKERDDGRARIEKLQEELNRVAASETKAVADREELEQGLKFANQTNQALTAGRDQLVKRVEELEQNHPHRVNSNVYSEPGEPEDIQPERSDG